MKGETVKVYATYREVRLIQRFLGGELKEGSAENLTARRALARLLRKPEQQLDLGLRWALAELFDPDRPLAYSRKGPVRLGRDDEQPFMIYLKRRRRGKPTKEAMDERDIAVFIWHQRFVRHQQMKNIILAAIKKFGLKRTQLQKIWKHWQPILKREYSDSRIRNTLD
jgi:hypothetical protein